MQILLGFMILILGMAVFMLSMKVLTKNLEKVADKNLEKVLLKVSGNRFSGLAIGAGITAVLHSSAATIILVIGFVNANVMNLYQATAIILGANVGTTVTGLFSAVATFDITIYAVVIGLVALALSLFIKNKKIKYLCRVVFGLGGIFLGLNIMGRAFNNQAMAKIIEKFLLNVSFPLLLVVFSMLITAVIQSSTVMVGLVITMSASGIIPLSSAIFVVLGADVGTCITALIASSTSNLNARRAATIQLIFNVLGTLLFTIVVWIFNQPLVDFLQKAFNNSAFAIAIFHMFFNLATALIFLPFVKQIVKLSCVLVKDEDRKKQRKAKKAKRLSTLN